MGRIRLVPTAVAALVLVAGAATPAFSSTAGAELDVDADVVEQKLENAPVPADVDLSFGAAPLQHVQTAASAAASAASCTLSNDEAVALVIAMTWPEVAPSGNAPSPMTLSRYDTQTSLGDPQDRAPGLWFHPGIGLWQLDSAGLGTDFTAAEAIDSEHAAGRMAPHIIDAYCDSINDGESAAAARRAAWQPWVACWEGACEVTYQKVLSDGITAVDGVDTLGGAEERRCWYAGAAHDCLFVDPANAQGDAWWAAPGGGASPIAAPFYVLKLDGSVPTEMRYWLSADSGASTDVEVRRDFGANARGGLTWTTGPPFCDLTEQRGDC